MVSPNLVEGLQPALHLQPDLVLGRAGGRLRLRSPDQELLLSHQLAYIPRMVDDLLQDGQLSWKITHAKREDVCELVAAHRLALGSDEVPALEAHLYLESPFSWWLAWLEKTCAAGEHRLCALRTGETREIASAYDGEESVEVFLVWSTHGVMLAGAGRMGDVFCEPLAMPLHYDAERRRSALCAGALRIPISSRHAPAIQAVVQACARPRALWKASVVAMVLGAQGALSAALLAQSPAYCEDAGVGWSAPLWNNADRAINEEGPAMLELGASLSDLWEVVRELDPVVAAPEAIELLQFDAWVSRLSVENLRTDRCFETPWPLGRWLSYLAIHWPRARREELVALLGQVRAAQPVPEGLDGVEATLPLFTSLALVYDHLGAPQPAHALLMELLDALPSPEDLELVLGEEDEQAPIRHLLDALVQRALSLWPDGAAPRTRLLETRVHLLPLSEPRLEAWAQACVDDPGMHARVTAVQSQLRSITAPGEPERAPQTWVHRLSAQQLETQVVHPAARRSRGGSWQAMLAKLETPDHSALKQFCDPGQEGVLAKEVELVASLFDRASVDVFVSHGERRFGVQAYEGDPSFLLVGGEHRRLDSAAHLDPLELRFVIAAELAHLYLGHARVTSQEVLSGALDKGKATFEILTSVVPFLSAFPWGQRLGRWAGYFDNKLVSRSARRIRDYFGDEAPDASATTTLDRSVGLIAAHRMIQLTADRAGLLATGHVGAAIVAMWKLRPQRLEYLELMQRQGLQAAIDAMAQAGRDEWRMLATRASALTAFALSEEYHALYTWLWGEQG